MLSMVIRHNSLNLGTAYAPKFAWSVVMDNVEGFKLYTGKAEKKRRMRY